MTFSKGFLLALTITFIGLVVWAGLNGDFMPEGAAIWSLPWGKVMLADLYLGFLLVSIIVLLIEPIGIAIPLILAIFLLGNWVSALWLVFRLPTLTKRLKG